METNVTVIRPSTRDATRDHLLRTHKKEATLEQIMDCLGPKLDVLDLRPCRTPDPRKLLEPSTVDLRNEIRKGFA
jgi:hypothetical protein